MKSGLIIMVAVAITAAVGGYHVARMLNLGAATPQPPALLTPGERTENTAGEHLVGRRRPDFALTDASGRLVAAEYFDGRVILVNFWATWCTPCTEEMPMLRQLQQEYADRGLAVVGIALDEPGRARQFAEDLDIDYTILFGLADAMLVGRQFGNRSGMLPYSVLVDAEGVIRWTRLGAVTRQQLTGQLEPLLQP